MSGARLRGLAFLGLVDLFCLFQLVQHVREGRLRDASGRR
ncbi:hypothetical protein SFR_6934 (plasmid) [Streptomyces sp. FR-008]|nr:hypothetical protein SFR_6934 [Streptomyces sp. FR-008]